MKKKILLIILLVLVLGAILFVLISCISNSKEVTNDTNKGNSQNQEMSDNEETSAKDEKYNIAIIAEEKGYYTIAKNLYNEILEYKDSKEHYENMITILKEYNGTYYGESTQRKNVNYYIYILDGEVRVQLPNSTSNINKYELYSYGTDKTTGNPILAFSEARTSLFESANDTKYGDGYAIQKLSDGSYLVAATEGSTYYTFNGFYEKISDNVEDSSIFE